MAVVVPAEPVVMVAAVYMDYCLEIAPESVVEPAVGTVAAESLAGSVSSEAVVSAPTEVKPGIAVVAEAAAGTVVAV